MKSKPVARSVAPQTLPPASGMTSSEMRPFDNSTVFHGCDSDACDDPSNRKYGYRFSAIGGTGSGSPNGYVGSVSVRSRTFTGAAASRRETRYENAPLTGTTEYQPSASSRDLASPISLPSKSSATAFPPGILNSQSPPRVIISHPSPSTRHTAGPTPRALGHAARFPRPSM